METPILIDSANYSKSKRAAIVIPVYKTNFTNDEALSLKSTFYHLGHRDEIYWLAPKGFDFSELDRTYGKRRYEEFPEFSFKSIADYSRLLLSPNFYTRFQSNHSHILIIQTDATVIRDELDFWLNQPFHYFGAPWPKGWSYPLKGVFKDGSELRCSALVGNGGFSLREIEPTLRLLSEFPLAVHDWIESGFPEDFYIGLAASISSFYKLPNMRVASRFSVELEPDFFNALNDGGLPFGLHAWHRYAPDYWRVVIESKLR